MIRKWRNFLEYNVYGVCDWWGDKLGIKSSKIRLFFIYFSFLALGSPVIIYLIMAFILDNKHVIKGKRKVNIWEL